MKKPIALLPALVAGLALTAPTPASAAVHHPMCDGKPATLVVHRDHGGAFRVDGTDGNDVIVGSRWGETIFGLGGHDLICARDGHDVLIGGDGNDVLMGGGDGRRKGANVTGDTLVGGRGMDVLIGDSSFGSRVRLPDIARYTAESAGITVDFRAHTASGTSAGHDRFDMPIVYGTAHNDTMLGAPGHQEMSGGGGDDLLNGRAGDDSIFAGTGTNVLAGGPGDDVLGDEGLDSTITAGDGDDNVLSENGTGTADLGPGDDQLGCTRHSAYPDTDGGPGFDKISTCSPVTVADFAAGTIEQSGFGEEATSQVTGFELLDSFSTKLTFNGSDGPDHVMLEGPFASNTNTMTLAMGAGDDVVETSSVYEVRQVAVDVDGGPGDDSVNLFGPFDRCHDVEHAIGCETVY